MTDTSSPGGPFGAPSPRRKPWNARDDRTRRRRRASPPNTAWSAPDGGWESPRAARSWAGVRLRREAGWTRAARRRLESPAPARGDLGLRRPRRRGGSAVSADPAGAGSAAFRSRSASPAPLRAGRRQRAAARRRGVPRRRHQSRLLAVARLHGGADAARRWLRFDRLRQLAASATPAAPARVARAVLPFGIGGGSGSDGFVGLRLRRRGRAGRRDLDRHGSRPGARRHQRHAGLPVAARRRPPASS